MPASSAGGGGESPRGREAPRRHAAATVSFDNSIAQNCRSAIVKSFRRRQASESRRGTNPRCAGSDLGGFDVLAVPGWADVTCAELDRVHIARAFPGDPGQYRRRLIGRFSDCGRDRRRPSTFVRRRRRSKRWRRFTAIAKSVGHIGAMSAQNCATKLCPTST